MDVIKALTEVLVRRILDLKPGQPVLPAKRRSAHQALSYWFDTAYEREVAVAWHGAKLQRLLKL